MVSPIIFDAVQQLISRSPHEKMERLVENLTPTKEAPGTGIIAWGEDPNLAVKHDTCCENHETTERTATGAPCFDGFTLQGQREQRVLDFAGVQQLLQYTSAARANEDLAPFLASNKSTPLLLRGPVRALGTLRCSTLRKDCPDWLW